MFSLTKRLQSVMPLCNQLRWAGTEAGQSRRRRHKSPALPLNKVEEKSEWWILDGEMHEIGDNVPLRERFVIPRENIPNKRRKQLRDQFMRRTRLVLKESEHEPWCKKYMELYQELRENWERLYWDEGYSKKLAQDHANYESAEDDDEDFSPYRSRRPPMEQSKDYNFVRNGQGDTLGKDQNFGRNRQGDTWEKDQNFGRNRQSDTWEKVRLIRDKFEYDRERRMREKAFAPMHGGNVSDYSHSSNQSLHGGTASDYSNSRNQPLDADRYFSPTERHS